MEVRSVDCSSVRGSSSHFLATSICHARLFTVLQNTVPQIVRKQIDLISLLEIYRTLDSANVSILFLMLNAHLYLPNVAFRAEGLDV